MINVQKEIELLGLTVQDKVTGFRGVIVSICFDLYGCIQALVHPGLNKDGEVSTTTWFDTNRLNVLPVPAVMELPNFNFGKGPENKPSMGKS